MWLALLGTLAWSAPPTSEAPTAPISDQAARDYADGYALGTTHAQNVQVGEWGAYGAAASCLGPVGCLGVTAGAMMLDPADVRPLRSSTPVPQVTLNNLPAPPPYVVDVQAWQQGYEAGWDARVQRRRTAWALAGGIAVPAAAATAYVTLVGTILWMDTR